MLRLVQFYSTTVDVGLGVKRVSVAIVDWTFFSFIVEETVLHLQAEWDAVQRERCVCVCVSSGIGNTFFMPAVIPL